MRVPILLAALQASVYALPNLGLSWSQTPRRASLKLTVFCNRECRHRHQDSDRQ